VELLATHFWAQLAGGAPPQSFLRGLDAHDWPGNVRELRNAVARQALLGDALEAGGRGGLDVTDAPSASPQADCIDRILRLDLPLKRARAEVLEEFERRYVRRALERNDGHVGRAAAASGVALRYFQLLKAKRAKS
jgi:DNA-binding NtrC family response regulator